MSGVIQFEHVSKFGLCDVNLHIPKGETVGIVGESGAGKTTLLKLACGLLAPQKGSVRMYHQDPVGYRKKYGRLLGVRFTGIPILSNEDTVKSGYRLIAAMYQMTKNEFEQEYEKLVNILGFKHFENEQVKNLSLGQRARAELGVILLPHPKVLILDEPTIGLDQDGKEALWCILKERVEKGVTLLISSHDMKEITHLCHRIVLLHKGYIEYYGDRDELCAKYHGLCIMEMRILGQLPDLGDLPLQKYIIQNDKLTLIYFSTYITSADILQQILEYTKVTELTIRKAGLEDIVLQQGLSAEYVGGNDGRIYRGKEC